MIRRANCTPFLFRVWYNNCMINGLATFEKAFIGTCHVVVASVYSVQFVSYLMPNTETLHRELGLKESARDRVENGVFSGINMVASFARLGDWVITQKWIVVAVVQIIALKMIAHIAGVFSYFKRSLDAVEALEEIERITSNFVVITNLNRHERDSLEVRKFAEWATLFSNTFLAVYSGVELAGLITGAILFSPVVLNLLLTAGFVSFAASMLFKFSSEPACRLIERYRANSGKNYSYQY